MALARVKIWGSEILTPSDLNAEIDNIINNAISLISPAGSDITWNDNVNATFGTGGDADIRYDATDLLILPAVVGTGDVRISGGSLRTQDSEGVWFGTGDDARIYYDATDMIFDSDVVGTGNFIFNAARMILLNDTVNANMTVGITINQSTNTNQILDFKQSNTATGLTTIPTQDVETDDYVTCSQVSAGGGGLLLQALGETTVSEALYFETWGGAPVTTDTTASLAAVNIFVGQHNGANARVDMAANSNALVVGEIDSAGATLVRMLLKADDGELHLGNTTLAALDEEDDIQAVRALQWANHGGRGMSLSPYEKPIYDFDSLQRMGVVGPKDNNGNFLIRVQPYLALHDGAIFQLASNMYALKDHVNERLGAIEQKLLEA